MKALSHSGHDVAQLLERWEQLIQREGWCRTLLLKEGEYPVFAIETNRGSERASGYVSTGVHGDECAPPWALLLWAEANASRLGEIPFTILPCLNPVGIVENTRNTGDGVDLNRNFQNREIPLIRAWQEFLKNRHFETALNLHEDYDATGIYLYEVAKENPRGEDVLLACESLIGRETAETVDGSAFENGLLSHDDNITDVIENDLEGAWPEALYLFLHHATDSYTFETPSEFALEQRIEAHIRCLETVFPLRE